MPLTFHHHSMHRCIRRPRCIRSDLIVRNVDRPLGERFLEVNACNKYNKLYNHFFGRLNI
ncbi:hypothetical protein V6Z11_D08G076000 [Gossypium hirsutum]